MTGAGARRKGHNAERAVVAWLQANGWPYAERRLAGGPNDTGDITGLPGVVLEVKNQARLDLAGWVDQLGDEMDEADTGAGAVIIKRRGRTDVGEWYAVMPVSVFAELLKDAGWGSW